MTRQEKKEELIGLFCMGAITIGDLIDEGFEFGQRHPRWISVEDELPPNKGGFSDEVLTYSYASKRYVVAMFCYISNCWFGCDDTVTHWMALPKPPEHIAGISNKTACPDCFVAQYPPCGKGIPCCKCHEEGCNSRQPCPKKGGEQ